MITIYAIPEQQTECDAHIADETVKHVWIDADRVVIYEGDDLPSD